MQIIRLSNIGESARNILAITGIFGLIYAAINFPDDYINATFDKHFNYDASVKPTCEPLPSLKVNYDNGAKAESRLMGITIRPINELENILFRIDDIIFIAEWTISSNSMTQQEANEIVKQLPKGEITELSVFGRIKRLMADSETIIQLQGVTRKKLTCDGDWFRLSAVNRKIAHLKIPDTYQIRGAQLGVKGNATSIYKWLTILFAFIAIVLFITRTKTTDKRVRFRIRKQ